jgi:hypothetical protein
MIQAIARREPTRAVGDRTATRAERLRPILTTTRAHRPIARMRDHDGSVMWSIIPDRWRRKTAVADEGDARMNITKNLGMLALAIYLIIVGVLGLGIISVNGLGTVVAIIAIAAGLLILVGK